MKIILKNNRGEAQVATAVKIVICVVIGALLLGGLYLLFAGDGGIMDSLNSEVEGMMGYEQSLRYDRIYDEDSGSYRLRYSYDGKHWNDAEMPSYSDTATVYQTMTNGSDTECIDVAVIKDGTTYYVLTSFDGGISWDEQISFTANSITHCYYGTSASLPWTSGNFSGEKFVIRYHKGGSTYYTMTSTGYTWSNSGWSDLIPIG